MNVNNCDYLPTNQPDYNQAGPALYHQPCNGAHNKVSYTLESIRRIHSQAHRLLRVSNHTATGIESLATLQGVQQVPLREPIKQTIELLTYSFNDFLPIVFDLEFKLRYMLRSGVIQFNMGQQTELPMSGQRLQQLLTALPGKSRTLFTVNKDFRDEGPPVLTEQEQAMARTPNFLRKLYHTLGGRLAVLGSIPVSAHSKQLATEYSKEILTVSGSAKIAYPGGTTRDETGELFPELPALEESSQHSTYTTASELQDQVMPRHSASNAGDSQPRLSSPPGLQSPQTPAATPRARSTPRTAESQASLPNADDSDVQLM